MYAVRQMPFVVVSSNHGSLIVNRNDHAGPVGQEYGVAHNLFTYGTLDIINEMGLFREILNIRRGAFGDGAVVLDCGANIGVYAIEFARIMNGWGHVYSFEAQEKIFYALAGNVIMNNCLNVTARWNALGSSMGTIKIPEPNYLKPASFGSFEIKASAGARDLGQQVDYAKPTSEVPMITLDSLNLSRVDLIKIDVEGMEEEVLAGAMETIKRCKPVLFIEVLKSDQNAIAKTLNALGYKFFPHGINVVALHDSDPVAHAMQAAQAQQASA